MIGETKYERYMSKALLDSIINVIEKEFPEEYIPKHYLDHAAKCNLNFYSYQRYLQYKKELYADGMDEEDIDNILAGFIWDESEEVD